MFGFIKNLFAGIFGFFAGLLGFKKSGYFLDLADDQEKKPSKTEPAKPVVAQALAAVAAPAKTKTEAAKPEKSASSKDKKSTKAAKKESEPAASPQPKPEAVKIPVATNGKSSQAQPVLTFAPNHLAPTPTSGRRLPGPSLNGFREMARQVKTK